MKNGMEKRIFGLVMAVMMVLGMEVYNGFLQHGLSWQTVAGLPWAKGGLAVVVVLLAESLVGRPLAAKIGPMLGSGPISQRLSMVLVMCPVMSLAAMFLFKGGWQAGFGLVWLKTVACNLPMAFCWSVLVAFPLTKFLVTKFLVEGLRNKKQQLI